MSLENFINFVIDANIALLIAAAIVLLCDGMLKFLGYRRAYKSRLQLVTASVYILVLLPLLLLLTKVVFGNAIPNFSDVMVSQYLQGNIAVTASNLDNMLSLRQHGITDLAAGTNATLMVLAGLITMAVAARAAYVVLSLTKVFWVVNNSVTIRHIGRVKIAVSDTAQVPFSTRGLWHYFVVVPQALLADSETLRLSVGHELQHVRQNDINCEILAAFASPLFVLNPAFWIMSQRLRRLREYTCDFAYLDRKKFSPHRYATGLLKVAEQAMAAKRTSLPNAFSVPLIGRSQLFSKSVKSGLAARVTVLSQGEVTHPNSKILAAFVLLILGTVTVGAYSMQRPNSWSHDRIMLTSVVNLERLNRVNSAVTLPSP